VDGGDVDGTPNAGLNIVGGEVEEHGHLNSIHRNTLLCNHNTVRRLRIDERNEQIMIKRIKIHELERNVGKLAPQAEQHIPSAQVVYSSHCLGDD